MRPDLPLAHIVAGQIPLVLSGLWMGLTGIGVNQARLFYSLIAWLSIPFIYLTVRRLYGFPAALLAAIIAGLVPLSHIYIRTDSVVALTLALALYFYFPARASGSAWQHFAAGLAVAFSVEGNYYGIRYALAFGLLYAIDYAVKARKERRWHWSAPFWAFALGGVTYVAFFVTVHILPAQGDALAYMMNQYSTETQIHAYTDPVFRLLNENFVFYRDYLGNHSLEVLLLVAGIVGAAIRRTDSDKRLLLILVGGRALLTIVLAHENPTYWVNDMPFIAILGGACLAQITGQLDSAQTVPLNLAGLLAALGLIVVFTTNIVMVGRSDNYDPVIAASRKIDQMLPPEMGVLAPNPYYLGMPLRKNFISDDVFESGDPETWVKQPPQAVIVPIGQSERPGLRAYIVRNRLSPADCFAQGFLGNPIILYLPKTQLSEVDPVNCNPEWIKSAP